MSKWGNAMWRALALMLAGALLGACAMQPASESYRILGRYAPGENGALRFAWPASGVEGRFIGARVTARVEDGGKGLMDVTVDGEARMLRLDAGVHEYMLFESAAPGEHVISFTRRSEIYDTGVTTLHSFATDGAWRALPPFAHRMLVVGDSLSAGQNAAGDGPDCPYAPDMTAPLQSYGALTAKAFNAELQLVAISGRGVIRNWDDSAAPRMPWQLDKALPDEETPLWDQAKFQPDLVVVNLGANDFSQGYPGQRFDDGYLALLHSLRSAYPHARIIAAFGPIEKDGANAAIQRALAAFDASEAAPTPFIFLHKAESGRVWGCSYHPGLDSHRAMADQLIGLITRELGWARVE
jgi:lysophospholipase L1-like esterase